MGATATLTMLESSIDNSGPASSPYCAIALSPGCDELPDFWAAPGDGEAAEVVLIAGVPSPVVAVRRRGLGAARPTGARRRCGGLARSRPPRPRDDRCSPGPGGRGAPRGRIARRGG